MEVESKKVRGRDGGGVEKKEEGRGGREGEDGSRRREKNEEKRGGRGYTFDIECDVPRE